MRLGIVRLALVMSLSGSLVRAADHASPVLPEVPPGMALVPAGVYQPPVRAMVGSNAVMVASFFLDVYPVTNEEFREFVRQNPVWQRSQVSRAHAEAGYLRDWSGDLDLGPLAPTNAPVVNISWHAARAYARWKGKRLPTTAEWELAARRPLRNDVLGRETLQQHILNWYAQPSPEVLPGVGATPANELGLHDLHGLIWEWVSDFGRYQPAGEDGKTPGGDVTCGAGSVNALDPSDYATFVRFGFRGSLRPEYVVHNLGFRCAQSVTPDASK